MRARTASPPGQGWLRQLRQAVLWHRRLLAAGLTAAAVAAALVALSPPAASTLPVLRAAHDVPAGTVVDADDVEVASVPPGLVPDGALRSEPEATGRVLAGPARKGEPLTDVRFVGPTQLTGYGRGVVGAPVRIADAQAVALLRPGDVVDVLAADLVEDSAADGAGDAQHAVARVAARRVRVVTVPKPADDSLVGTGTLDAGALVVFATTPEVAGALARAAVTSRLSIILRADVQSP